MSDWKDAIKAAADAADDRFALVNEIRQFIHDQITPNDEQPVDMVKWVDVDEVQANDYNPNSVAGTEMQLLYRSIKNDGYTQPVVTIWDETLEKYVIIDGFHRYFTLKSNADLQEWTHGKLPVVVLKKEMNERMAATVRHNRARGSHSVGGMSNMVFKMLDNGWSDEHICNHLGMDADELLRLKHITGFSKLFENAEYNRAWVTKHQLALKKQVEQDASGAALDDNESE
jgi:ParB-like chromosome segregation protein Spo0J